MIFFKIKKTRNLFSTFLKKRKKSKLKSSNPCKSIVSETDLGNTSAGLPDLSYVVNALPTTIN